MPDDAQADLYEATSALTEADHAISEAHRSQHNMIYWRSGDWIGIGPGAHGRLTIDGKRIATEAARRPGDYIENSVAENEVLSDLDTHRETLAMGLRPSIGIETRRLTGTNEAAIKELEKSGLIEITGGRLRTTPKGRLLTDAIAARISP